MKQFIVIIAVVLLMFLTACSPAPTPVETEAPTEAPTEALYIDTPIDEPEWTLAEGALQLEDDDNIYAESADILYFAIVTDSDGEQELWFRLNDETSNMLQTQSADNGYYVTLDGEKIGDATLNEDCTIIIISKEDTVGDITALASKIRGLSE